MKKFTILFALAIFLFGCSSNIDQQLKLSCETKFTKDKINHLMYRMEDNIQRPSGYDFEASVSNALMKTELENIDECIKKDYPYEKHVYIFNKKDMTNIGRYDISKSSSYCRLTLTEMLESLSVMKVTDNYIDFGENLPMRVDKMNMSKGKKLTLYKNQETFGPYEYECSLKRYR